MIRFLILTLLLALPASADRLEHELELYGLKAEEISEAGHHAFISSYFRNSFDEENAGEEDQGGPGGGCAAPCHDGTSTTTVEDLAGFVTLTFDVVEERDQTPPHTELTWDVPSSSWTLGGLEVSEQFAVRVSWDIDPAVDETTCTLRLLFTRGGSSSQAGTTFTIDHTLPHMNKGAGIDYTQTAFIPVFVSSSLADHPSLSPTLRIQSDCDQEAEIQIRDTVFYIWK